VGGNRLDYEKLNRTNRMRQNGSEPAEGQRGPTDQPATRPEERVRGLQKAAKARTKADREELLKLEKRMELWAAASDVSSLEMDKLRRRILRLRSTLPALKIAKSGKRPRSEKKKRAKK
jgi:hypothetical protein